MTPESNKKQRYISSPDDKMNKMVKESSSRAMKSTENRMNFYLNIILFGLLAIISVIVGIAYQKSHYLEGMHSPNQPSYPHSSSKLDSDISSRVKRVKTGWLPDEIFYQLSLLTSEESCDFPVISEKELLENPFQYLSLPFVLRGAISSWPASEKWTRQNLITLYGKRSIQTGSESSITYSGGSASVSLSLEKMLQNIRNEQLQNQSNLFSFDVSILKSIPELKQDFSVPKIFRSWDNFEAETHRHSWNMLSLGPSRAGLPFHVHGMTWIAVVHGMKRWFVYPPGASAPIHIQKEFNPLESVWEWFHRIYPMLEKLEKPLFSTLVQQSSDHLGYKPLECIQYEGDVLYLPKAWSHMTINIGETIGIGGQAAFTAHDRYDHATNVLKSSPFNFDALKGISLGLTHFAVDEKEDMRRGLLKTSSGVIQLRPDNFHHLVSSSNDTWVVIYAYLKDHSRESEYMMKVSNEIAAAVTKGGKIEINIGIVEINKYPELIDEHLLKESCLNREKVDDPNQIFPCIRIYPGSPTFTSCKQIIDTTMDSQSYSSSHSRFNSHLFSNGVTYDGSIESDKMIDYLENFVIECNLDHGSILSNSVNGRFWFQEAIKYIKLALEVEPLNSEINSLYAEILGYSDDGKAMVETLVEAEQKYDDVIRKYKDNHKSLPTQSIASIYQKIGHTYLTKEYAAQSLPLLQKSLDYQPNYSPALVSKVIAYNMLNDMISAEKTLIELERIEPINPAIRDLKGMMKMKKNNNNKKTSTPNSKSKLEENDDDHHHHHAPKKPKVIKEDHPTYTVKKKKMTPKKINFDEEF